MNYSDFDYILEDDWSRGGVEYLTPKNGKIRILGYAGRTSSGNKKYVILCSVCMEDKQLFGDGLFLTTKGAILRGSFTCGCAKKRNWNVSEYTILCERSLALSPYKLVSVSDEFMREHTAISVHCPTHGEWKSTIRYIITKRFCPTCAQINRNKKDDSLHFSDLNKIDSLKNIYDLKRADADNIIKKYRKYWSYKCKKCSNDEFVKAGLCTGIFCSQIGNLKAGKLSCRCSKVGHWTQEQREYQINTSLLNTGYSFSGWYNGKYKNSNSKFILKCKEHGDYVKDYPTFCVSKICPECVNDKTVYAYINQIEHSEIIKFGISSNVFSRLTRQNSINKVKMENICIFKFPNSKLCKAAEKACKKELRYVVSNKEDMKDGYTETRWLSDIYQIVNIFKKYQGINFQGGSLNDSYE